MKPLAGLSRQELIERINELEEKLRKCRSDGESSGARASSLFEFSEKGLRLKLYRLLLKKYAGIINEKEKRTIGEVKGLVNGDDLTIQSIVSEFKDPNYVPERGFFKAAKKAFEFVKREIHFVKADIDLDFFLSPLEIMTEKVADDQDQAVFLCSLFSALGHEGASVVIAEMDDLKTHAFVILDYNGKAFFLDPTQDHGFEDFSGETAQVLKNYSYRGVKIRRLLYKFNNYEYRSFIEEE